MEQLFENLNINDEILDILCKDSKIERIGKIDGEGIDFHGKRLCGTGGYSHPRYGRN